MYDVIVYSGTVLPALGPFKKISLSGYSTLVVTTYLSKVSPEQSLVGVDPGTRLTVSRRS